MPTTPGSPRTQSRSLLEAYGIRLVGEALAADAEAAVTAATALGLPGRRQDRGAGAHKTETGGVALDLRDATAVRGAAARIGGALLVQQMREGAELLAGVVRDPVSGRSWRSASAACWPNSWTPYSFRVAPLTDFDAAELLAAGPVGRLVAGFRGRPPLDGDGTPRPAAPSLGARGGRARGRRARSEPGARRCGRLRRSRPARPRPAGRSRTRGRRPGEKVSS